MEIKTLDTYNNINNIDFGDNIVIFKFGGSWCGPCHNLEKILKDIPSTVLYNISVDNSEFESHLIEKKIYTIPHCFLKCGKEIVDFKGEKTKDEIIKICESLRLVSAEK